MSAHYPCPAPGRHPLIDGLFESLPPIGARWSPAERAHWLAAAAAVFAVVYPLGAAEAPGPSSERET